MRSILCRSSAIVGLVLLLVLGAVAHAGAVEIRDFAEIEATRPTIVPDPSGTSAVLEVETTIDVACAVVYGTDGSFGRIATDADMQGGAHRVHRPVLGGLEPDTEYHYRLQGSGPDGSLYVSETFTFRTPPAVEGPPNLALDAEVSGVSSEHSDAFAAELAIDGRLDTAWSSAGEGDEAWIEIDLGRRATIAEVAFRSRSMSDGSSTTISYSITADGEALGTFEAERSVPLDLQARVLRFDVVDSTGGNTGASEIVVVGEP